MSLLFLNSSVIDLGSIDFDEQKIERKKYDFFYLLHLLLFRNAAFIYMKSTILKPRILYLCISHIEVSSPVTTNLNQCSLNSRLFVKVLSNVKQSLYRSVFYK